MELISPPVCATKLLQKELPNIRVSIKEPTRTETIPEKCAQGRVFRQRTSQHVST